MEEIGNQPSPPEWVKYGIPEGTPKKKAILLRLFHAIVEEKAYYLIPKLWEYAEPSTKQIELNVTDWRTRFEQAGVPMSLVAERLRLALTQAMEENAPSLIDAPQPTDVPANRIIEPSRGVEPDSAGRPGDADGDAEPAGGQEAGEVALGSYAETETPE